MHNIQTFMSWNDLNTSFDYLSEGLKVVHSILVREERQNIIKPPAGNLRKHDIASQAIDR